MTLDEAIAHAKEVAENARYTTNLVVKDKDISEEEKEKCIKCAKEHEQLAEWLEELKELRHTVSLLKFNIHALNELIKEGGAE